MMTTDRQQEQYTEGKQPVPFGARLKSTREALGFERKDAALKLRLSEKVILMMERDRYPSDLPVTFIRGYLRAYAKLLEIPEYEVKKAIEPIKAKTNNNGNSIPALKNIEIDNPSNRYMHIFTILIVLTLVGLMGMWWHTHSAQTQEMVGPITTSEEINPNSPTPAELTPLAPNPGEDASSLAQTPTQTETTEENNNPKKITQRETEATSSTPTKITGKNGKFIHKDTYRGTENDNEDTPKYSDRE